MRPSSDVVQRWRLGDELRDAPDRGLINETWVVGDPPQGVLQWVNPLFRPAVNLDIAAVTARLAVRGMPTPLLLPTEDGRLWVEAPSGSWRMLSYVPGTTVHRLDSEPRAAAAGALVGRFHDAMAGWDYTFAHVRSGAHDTPRHMATLRDALSSADPHPLAQPARALGARILDAWQTWDGSLDLPLRVCHGDLKISNVRFDEAGRDAVCLIDLDTLAHLPLAVELGDAWRSWCNRSGEDDPTQARFDTSLFEASARAWMGSAPPITLAERDSLAGGTERICLELASRFCADAVRNTYFRENRARWPEPGRHNLLRAEGQLRLAASARDARSRCESVIASARVD